MKSFETFKKQVFMNGFGCVGLSLDKCEDGQTHIKIQCPSGHIFIGPLNQKQIDAFSELLSSNNES